VKGRTDTPLAMPRIVSDFKIEAFSLSDGYSRPFSSTPPPGYCDRARSLGPIITFAMLANRCKSLDKAFCR